MTETSAANGLQKRFVPSSQEFASDRMRFLKKEIYRIKQEHPEVLSICMFGSMVTSKANPTSDIDGFLFVDASLVSAIKGIGESDITETEIGFTGVPTTFFTKEVTSTYVDKLQQHLIEELKLSGQQVAHIAARPVSETIIDCHVDRIILRFKSWKDYREALSEWKKSGENLIGEEWATHCDKKPIQPPDPASSSNLSGMFHMDIGGGIGVYRQYLLNKLRQMGNVGENIWGIIIGETEMWENHFHREAKKAYPRTLEQATKAYGLNP